MDEEELQVEIADAQGRSAALSLLMASMVAVFVNKKLLTNEEAAEITGLAKLALGETKDISDDARLLAESALKGFATSWTKLVTRH